MDGMEVWPVNRWHAVSKVFSVALIQKSTWEKYTLTESTVCWELGSLGFPKFLAGLPRRITSRWLT